MRRKTKKSTKLKSQIFFLLLILYFDVKKVAFFWWVDFFQSLFLEKSYLHFDLMSLSGNSGMIFINLRNRLYGGSWSHSFHAI